MGDRASISFKKDGDESVALFSHWGGKGFFKEAKEYVKKLKMKHTGKSIMPIDRLDPETVMVDFIRHITRDMKEVEGDLYLGKDEHDGDNSDNGHQTINLD